MSKLAMALFLLISAPLQAQTWTRVHGGPDQAGFADVDTSPIDDQTPVTRIPVQGPFAPAIGPVIGNDGTAYLATLDGAMIVVAGNKATTVAGGAGRHSYTSPLIGADGAVYVTTSAGLGAPAANDHRTVHAWLARYSAQGALQWERPLPVHIKDSGAALALNAVGTGPSEVILVAARERLRNGAGWVNLVGFDRTGTMLFNQDVGGSPPESVSGDGWLTKDNFCLATAIFGTIIWYPPCQLQPFLPPAAESILLPQNLLRLPPVGIAIAANNIIVVTDGYRGVRGYAFTPAGGLVKLFEKIDGRDLTTSAAILPTQRSVYGVAEARIAFAGPSTEHVADILHDPNGDADKRVAVVAMPTRLADGRLVTLGFDGKMTIVANVVPASERPDAGAQTVAAAAASREMLYVSVRNALVSFDAATGRRLAAFSLTGGLYPPAIGRDGRVYVLTDDELLIFRAAATSHVRGRAHIVPTRPVQPR